MTWFRYYTWMILVHVLEVVIIGSAVTVFKWLRPEYDLRDLLVIIAVGMIAGALYPFCMSQIKARVHPT